MATVYVILENYDDGSRVMPIGYYSRAEAGKREDELWNGAYNTSTYSVEEVEIR